MDETTFTLHPKIQKSKDPAKGISQEEMKVARTYGNYGQIWQNTGKCVFCDLRDKYVLYEENGIALTINLYPYIDGQLMAVPRRHVKSPKELTDGEWETMRKFSYLSKKLIREVHGHKGMWSLLREGGDNAQMTVSDHLHMQFIPFDNPDLCKWNFRELKYTPLENVQKYKDEASMFTKSLHKFEEKYSAKQLLPIVCDLIIVNKQNKILFCERKDEFKLDPDYLTFPGGHVDNAREGLLGALKKEIKEELNYELDVSRIELLDSQISSISHVMKHTFEGKKISRKSTFVWNVYVLKDFDDEDKLKPGDDTEGLIWLSYDEVINSDSVSDDSKVLVKKVL